MILNKLNKSYVIDKIKKINAFMNTHDNDTDPIIGEDHISFVKDESRIVRSASEMDILYER